MLPNFLLIGAMKAGTTALYKYLQSHPDIFMSPEKEPHFFSLQWEDGIHSYERLFEGVDGEKAVGEGSTSYTGWPTFDHVPERIASVIPSVKLVYVVRNPIERMRSHWLHRASTGRILPIDRELFENPIYLERSSYSTQIERYLEHFQRDQLKVIISERLRQSRHDTIKEVYRFLGVDEGWVSASFAELHHETAQKRVRYKLVDRLRGTPLHRRLGSLAPYRFKLLHYRMTTRGINPARSKLSAETRKRLEDVLAPEIRRLRRYLDDPTFDGWGIA